MNVAFNQTNAERQESAIDQLALKLKLETRATRELRELFRRMSVDFEAFFAVTGRTPDVTIYDDDFKGIISRQYRRTSDAFSGSVTGMFDEAKEDDLVTEGMIATALALSTTLPNLITDIDRQTTIDKNAFIAAAVAANVINISDTNQKQMNESVAKAATDMAEAGETPTRETVAKIAAKDFKEKGKSRAETISATITQDASEGTKQIERDAITGVGAGVATGFIINQDEVWVTVGDARVRAAHVAADGQLKGQDGVFRVGDELLKRPGDRSLGASAGNTINCRCVALSVITGGRG